MHKYVTAVLCFGSLFSLAGASEPTVCAVIKAETSADISTGALEYVELQLLETDDVAVVERTAVDRVFAELALSTAQGDLNLGRRLQLGNLLKADLLVFVSESKRNEITTVGARVVESETGLQLAAETLIWDAKNAETLLASLADVVRNGLERHTAGYQAVLAVPPLECADRGPAQAHWRKPLATILGQRLLRHQGILVVELEEARAFTTEFFIGQEPARLKRSLPFYLIGKYETKADGDDVAFSVDLRLNHGEKEVFHTTVADVGQPNVADRLCRLADEIAQSFGDGDTPTPPADSKKEAAILAKRADFFRMLGDYDVAMPLYESVLLLDPDNIDARIQLLSVLSWFARSQYGGYRDYFTDPWFPKNAGRRLLWVAERGIEHLEYLYANASLSSSLQKACSSFRSSVINLHDYASRPSDFRDHVLRFYRRREAAYLHMISRLQKTGRFDAYAQVYLIIEFGYIINNTATADPAAAIASMRQLMDTVRPQDQAVLYLTAAVFNLGRVVDRIVPVAYEQFLDELATSNRFDLRTTGKLGRIYATINSPETGEKALVAMRALDEWDKLAAHQRKWLEKSAKSRAESRGRLERAISEKPHTPVFIPRLEAVSLSLEGGGPLANRLVFDWVVCGQYGDCIATDVGIFLADGQSGRRLSPLVAASLCWDGRWIWALTEKAIVAIEPQMDTVLTFGPDEVGEEVSVRYVLCPVKPGEIAVAGYLFGAYRSFRTWVSLLELEESPEGISKKAKVIYDARQQYDRTKDSSDQFSPDEAFVPFWALTWKRHPSDDVPLLVVGRASMPHVQPLLIDLKDHSASVLQIPWPGFRNARDVESCAFEHSGVLYIASGKISYIWAGKVAYGQYWAGVFQLRDIDALPESLANFGVHHHAGSGLYGVPCFRSAVVYDNVLHLATTVRHVMPNWVAVDLETHQTFELVTQLPDRYWGKYGLLTSSKMASPERNWGGRRLVVSSKHGLVFLGGGHAYSVTLPDRESWPHFPETPTNETTLNNWPPKSE